MDRIVYGNIQMNLYKFIYLKGVYVTIKRPYSLNVLLLNIADAIDLNLCLICNILQKRKKKEDI